MAFRISSIRSRSHSRSAVARSPTCPSSARLWMGVGQPVIQFVAAPRATYKGSDLVIRLSSALSRSDEASLLLICFSEVAR